MSLAGTLDGARGRLVLQHPLITEKEYVFLTLARRAPVLTFT